MTDLKATAHKGVIDFSQEREKHYNDLYASMELASNAPRWLITARMKLIMQNRNRYWELSDSTDVPWPVIAVIHHLEANCNFNKHLHNGDPLTARTVHVPKDRPVANPINGVGQPYLFEESALDALNNHCDGTGTPLSKIEKWNVARMLFVLESYNGYGYLLYHPQVNSPYLWSFSNHYTKGKYESDGNYNPNLISKQLGAALLLKPLLIEDKRLYDEAMAKKENE